MQGSLPILDSLFADSVPTGARSMLYTRLFMCSILSQGVGPLLAACLFWLHGNKWQLDILQKVMGVGVALAVVPAAMLWWFDDKAILGLQSEGVLSGVRHIGPQRSLDRHKPTGRKQFTSQDAMEHRRPLLEHCDEHEGPPENTEALNAVGAKAPMIEDIVIDAELIPETDAHCDCQCEEELNGRFAATAQVRVQSAEGVANDEDFGACGECNGVLHNVGSLGDVDHRYFGCLTVKAIPAILALSDCTSGLASGMTIKFFPIFFKDQVRLSPLSVNMLYCCIPLTLSLCSWIGQKLSRRLGRVQTIILFRIIGISLLYTIASKLRESRVYFVWYNDRLRTNKADRFERSFCLSGSA